MFILFSSCAESCYLRHASISHSYMISPRQSFCTPRPILASVLFRIQQHGPRPSSPCFVCSLLSSRRRAQNCFCRRLPPNYDDVAFHKTSRCRKTFVQCCRRMACAAPQFTAVAAVTAGSQHGLSFLMFTFIHRARIEECSHQLARLQKFCFCQIFIARTSIECALKRASSDDLLTAPISFHVTPPAAFRFFGST